ncbi:MAG TPA: alpha/beta hydrolase [Bryobacteraceae bacterium]|jgi:pimeloyl-ACP methyl ester carboxylesterase|nr:alpha/beta hydrolase [Bryobacteraceae bacterium]
MRRSAPAIAAIILIPLAAVTGLPVMRYLQSDQESLDMDEQARRQASGSFVRLSDGVTHYQLGGPSTGVPVLLVPGFSTPYNVWDPTYDGLTNAGFRVLRYELFGRGFSDRPSARYDADFYDRQIVELLDALAISQVDIAGLSMGGPISVTFANRHPERVRRVLLFDPGYWTGISLPYGLRLPVLGTYNMAVAVGPGLPKSQWADFLHPERHPHYLDPYLDQMRYRGFRRAILETLRNYLTSDVTGEFPRLGRSGKPVLLIWGRSDQDVPIGLSAEIRRAIPQAEFHPIDDAAHIPHYEHSEVVNPIVIEFLRR